MSDRGIRPRPPDQTRRCGLSLTLVLGVATTMTLSSALGISGAGQADAGLLVKVDDGATRSARGGTVDYRITVRNGGVDEAKRLVVTLTTPPVLRVTDVHGGQSELPTKASWLVDVAAGGSATVELSATVDETPADTAEVVVTACASPADPELPASCHTDLNDIDQAGVAHDNGFDPMVALTVVGQLLLAVPLLLILVALCRRRRDPAAPIYTVEKCEEPLDTGGPAHPVESRRWSSS